MACACASRAGCCFGTVGASCGAGAAGEPGVELASGTVGGACGETMPSLSRFIQPTTTTPATRTTPSNFLMARSLHEARHSASPQFRAHPYLLAVLGVWVR